MSTTIDDDVTTETPPKPTKRQRQAANIADAASGSIKVLLLKLVLLGILVYQTGPMELAGHLRVLGWSAP